MLICWCVLGLVVSFAYVLAQHPIWVEYRKSESKTLNFIYRELPTLLYLIHEYKKTEDYLGNVTKLQKYMEELGLVDCPENRRDDIPHCAP